MTGKGSCAIGGVEDGVVGAGEIADPAECAKITDLGVSEAISATVFDE